MHAIYLSHMTVLISPTIMNADAYHAQPHLHIQKDNPLHWFFADNAVSIDPLRIYDRHAFVDGKLSDIQIPTFTSVNSEIAVRLLEEQDLDFYNISFLAYCHETIENSHSMLPALRVKSSLNMKQCLPFSLCQQGSLACLSGVELAQALLQEEAEQVLIAIVDVITPPFSRFHYSGHLKGDAGASMLLTMDSGDYRVVEYAFSSNCLATRIQHWAPSDYAKAEAMLCEEADRLIMHALRKHTEITWVIRQHVSAYFTKHVDTFCSAHRLNCWERREWSKINLLGSDPFVSLAELELTGNLHEGHTVLLLFASVDQGVGSLLLHNEQSNT